VGPQAYPRPPAEWRFLTAGGIPLADLRPVGGPVVPEAEWGR
jgi:hypothetical protein